MTQLSVNGLQPKTDTLEQQHIAIIGGGMVGLLLANLLLSELPETVSLTLLEQRDFEVPSHEPTPFSHDPRSTALSRGTVRLLRALGVWDEPFEAKAAAIPPARPDFLGYPLVRQATPITHVSITDEGKLGAAHYGDDELPISSASPSLAGLSLGYVLANSAISGALYQRSKHFSSSRFALKTRAQVRSVDYSSRADPAMAKPCLNVLRGGLPDEQLEADLVVVVDGVASSLCQQLAIDVAVKPYAQRAIVGNVHFQRSHEGCAFERFTSRGPLAVLPLDGLRGKQGSLVWTCPDEDWQAYSQLEDHAFIEQLQQVLGYRLGKIRAVEDRSHFPLSLRLAKEQVRSGVVLMGNSAHLLHPVAGQGFNLAVRDCEQLAAVLRTAIELDEPLGNIDVLQRYEKQQHWDQFATTRISDQFNHWFTRQDGLAVGGRTMGLWALEALKAPRHSFFEQMMGLNFPRADLRLYRQWA